MSQYSINRPGRCPSCGATLRADGRCFACGFIRGAGHPKRVVVDGLVYDADKVPQEDFAIQIVDQAPRGDFAAVVDLAALKITAGGQDGDTIKIVTVYDADEVPANSYPAGPAVITDYVPITYMSDFGCPDCGLATKSAAGLAAHRRSKHPEPVSG